MDDPTKDTIPRSAVEYCLRKETVSTNPEKYKTHEKFIDYMNDPDISEFGHWMHSNGFNCALTAISVDLKKIPSVTPSSQPGWIPCRTALPKEDGQYIVTVKYEHVDGYEDIYSEHGEWVDGHWDAGYGHCGRVEKVLAWQPLPTPYREGGQS